MNLWADRLGASLDYLDKTLVNINTDRFFLKQRYLRPAPGSSQPSPEIGSLTLRVYKPRSDLQFPREASR